MKKQIGQNFKKEKGITLVALVITIIVLLILSGISIGMITGNSGIIKNAITAKENSEISEEKEIVTKSAVKAMGKDKYGNIVESEFQKQLDNSAGEGKTKVSDIGDRFEVEFIESKRLYEVDIDGNVSDNKEIITDPYSGDITKGIDGTTLLGTEESPFEIWCIEDLVTFSNIVNGKGIKIVDGEIDNITRGDYLIGKYIKVKKDLNFKSKYSYANSERKDFGDINENGEIEELKIEMTTGKGFYPIGDASYTFRRIF